jgi:hypothetical protein
MYTAKALTTAGLPCTHETIFTGRSTDTAVLGPGRAESSWFAVPFMERLAADTLVVHQVRHPLECIRSYVDRGFFTSPSYERPFWRHVVKRAVGAPPSGQHRIVKMVQSVEPEVFALSSAAERGALFWIRWNRRVEENCRRLGLDYRRVRVERLDSAAVVDLVNSANVTVADGATSRVRDVPRHTNGQPKWSSIAWPDLGRLGPAVRALAEAYGYGP